MHEVAAATGAEHEQQRALERSRRCGSPRRARRRAGRPASGSARRGGGCARARARGRPRAPPARADRDEPARDGEPELRGPRPGRERAREAVREQVELRQRDAAPGGEPLDGRVQRAAPRRPAARGRRRARARPGPRTSSRRARAAARRRRRLDAPRRPPIHQPSAANTATSAEQQEHALSSCARRGARGPQPLYVSSSPGSSSASPRGGQSGSGASQRLEQWREAMFWSGIRMCPFSSMWATSSSSSTP